jgi:hypothetical protein
MKEKNKSETANIQNNYSDITVSSGAANISSTTSNAPDGESNAQPAIIDVQVDSRNGSSTSLDPSISKESWPQEYANNSSTSAVMTSEPEHPLLVDSSESPSSSDEMRQSRWRPLSFKRLDSETGNKNSGSFKALFAQGHRRTRSSIAGAMSSTPGNRSSLETNSSLSSPSKSAHPVEQNQTELLDPVTERSESPSSSDEMRQSTWRPLSFQRLDPETGNKISGSFKALSGSFKAFVEEKISRTRSSIAGATSSTPENRSLEKNSSLPPPRESLLDAGVTGEPALDPPQTYSNSRPSNRVHPVEPHQIELLEPVTVRSESPSNSESRPFCFRPYQWERLAARDTGGNIYRNVVPNMDPDSIPVTSLPHEDPAKALREEEDQRLEASFQWKVDYEDDPDHIPGAKDRILEAIAEHATQKKIEKEGGTPDWDKFVDLCYEGANLDRKESEDSIAAAGWYYSAGSGLFETASSIGVSLLQAPWGGKDGLATNLILASAGAFVTLPLILDLDARAKSYLQGITSPLTELRRSKGGFIVRENVLKKGVDDFDKISEKIKNALEEALEQEKKWTNREISIDIHTESAPDLRPSTSSASTSENPSQTTVNEEDVLKRAVKNLESALTEGEKRNALYQTFVDGYTYQNVLKIIRIGMQTATGVVTMVNPGLWGVRLAVDSIFNAVAFAASLKAASVDEVRKWNNAFLNVMELGARTGHFLTDEANKLIEKGELTLDQIIEGKQTKYIDHKKFLKNVTFYSNTKLKNVEVVLKDEIKNVESHIAEIYGMTHEEWKKYEKLSSKLMGPSDGRPRHSTQEKIEQYRRDACNNILPQGVKFDEWEKAEEEMRQPLNSEALDLIEKLEAKNKTTHLMSPKSWESLDKLANQSIHSIEEEEEYKKLERRSQKALRPHEQRLLKILNVGKACTPSGEDQEKLRAFETKCGLTEQQVQDLHTWTRENHHGDTSNETNLLARLTQMHSKLGDDFQEYENLRQKCTIGLTAQEQRDLNLLSGKVKEIELQREVGREEEGVKISQQKADELKTRLKALREDQQYNLKYNYPALSDFTRTLVISALKGSLSDDIALARKVGAIKNQGVNQTAQYHQRQHGSTWALGIGGGGFKKLLDSGWKELPAIVKFAYKNPDYKLPQAATHTAIGVTIASAAAQIYAAYRTGDASYEKDIVRDELTKAKQKGEKTPSNLKWAGLAGRFMAIGVKMPMIVSKYRTQAEKAKPVLARLQALNESALDRAGLPRDAEQQPHGSTYPLPIHQPPAVPVETPREHTLAPFTPSEEYGVNLANKPDKHETSTLRIRNEGIGSSDVPPISQIISPLPRPYSDVSKDKGKSIMTTVNAEANSEDYNDEQLSLAKVQISNDQSGVTKSSPALKKDADTQRPANSFGDDGASATTSETQSAKVETLPNPPRIVDDIDGRAIADVESPSRDETGDDLHESSKLGQDDSDSQPDVKSAVFDGLTVEGPDVKSPREMDNIADKSASFYNASLPLVDSVDNIGHEGASDDEGPFMELFEAAGDDTDDEEQTHNEHHDANDADTIYYASLEMQSAKVETLPHPPRGVDDTDARAIADVESSNHDDTAELGAFIFASDDTSPPFVVHRIVSVGKDSVREAKDNAKHLESRETTVEALERKYGKITDVTDSGQVKNTILLKKMDDRSLLVQTTNKDEKQRRLLRVKAEDLLVEKAEELKVGRSVPVTFMKHQGTTTSSANQAIVKSQQELNKNQGTSGKPPTGKSR